MAHILDAVIQLRDNFSGTIRTVEKNLGSFSRTLQRTGRDIQRTGRNVQSFGGTLTRSITLPAVAATTAIGGMVASFGWGRLTSLDAARAKLKGLGYEAQDVERITEQVRNAVQGTTMTMAEGTAVAAGALAAGVAEGAELENYIRQVGNAAVGANREIADMAMIFNRVQGMGKLMTQELNMIEDGMPGFAQAMADALGVTQADFRKMVTEGEVTSQQFLAVMEDFAGGMSEAYAESWAGMVSNTKAWIGIIGENLLGGVFEQSKDIIAELMGFLKSDEVQQWAKTTGKAINETFAGMIETVKSVIDWWTSLDSNTQKLIGQIALFAVAAGPVISVIGKMTMGVGKLVFNIGKFAGAVKKVGLIGAIVNPGTIVLGVILALIAAGYLLWKNWDAIKAKVNEVFPNLRDQISTSMEHAKNIFTGVVQAIIFIWERVAPVLAVQWEIIKNLFFVAVETIIGVVGGVLRTFSGIIDFLTGVFTGNWELAWQGIVDIFGGIFDGLVALAKAPLNAIIGLINGVITGLNKISLPDWVPGLGGKGVNIPLIPKLATGTLSWPGGIAQVHERGGEIIDLPKGSRVYPHDESVRMAREQGRTEASKHISIEKLADTLIVREEADINKIATALVKKLAQAELAYGGDW